MSTVVYYAQINLTCILLLCIIRFCLPRDSYKSTRGRLYKLMIIAAIAVAMSDLVAGVLRGSTFTGARILLWLSNILFNLSLLAIAIIWILFSSVILKGELSRKIIMAVGTFGAVIFILNIMTPFNGMIFTLDENNLYHRGNLVWLNWAFIIPCELFPILALPFFKVEKRVRVAICMYPIFPFICTGLQYVFYGISLGQVGITATVLIIYIFFQGDEITEHKRKQEKLKEESLKSRNASEAKGRFLANVSHEIRTPINAVLGMDTMILRESKEPQIRAYARDIQSAGRTLLALINDILDLSKVESGKLEIIEVEYELKKLVNDVYNMLRFKADAKGLELIVNLDKNLPNGLIGDDVRVRQILVNILNNAIKYTESGSVTLDISGEENDEGLILNVSIKDTGIGIKEEDMAKLFDEFARLEEARNRNVEGTGLGMNITMQLLSLMGSELKIDSVYGKGTTVYFDLFQGVYGAELVKDFATTDDDFTDDEIYEASFEASDARILVVDDNKINRDVFCFLLKETKMQIDTGVDGKDALEKILSTKYDIIFLDHMMPEMDGIEVLERVKASKNNPNVDTIFIILTANAISGAKEMYLNAGFDAYLSKPVMPEELEKALRMYLPKEKVLISNKQKKQLKDENLLAKKELPGIEGLDWNLALLHLENKELLLKTVESFYASMELEAKELMDSYNKILKDDTYLEAIDQYRIKVHSMKSAANLIGIFPLAGSAAMLEYAARDGKRQEIIEVTPYFVEIWNSYRDKLIDFAPKDLASNKLKVEGEAVSTIADSLNSLVEYMHSFDVKAADGIIEILNEFDFSKELMDLFIELKGYVSNLDDDGVENTAMLMFELLKD